MGAPHYALSEALIVIAACLVAWRLARQYLWLAAAGVLLLGTAAGIGTVRFGMGMVDGLADVHRLVSQAGGATAMALIALQCAFPLDLGRSRVFGSLALGIATLTASVMQPASATPLFIVWLVVAIGAAFFRPASQESLRWLRAGVIAIFLFNVLLVRRSLFLEAGVSWHLFHGLIALWLLGLWWVLVASQERVSPLP